MDNSSDATCPPIAIAHICPRYPDSAAINYDLPTGQESACSQLPIRETARRMSRDAGRRRGVCQRNAGVMCNDVTPASPVGRGRSDTRST
ncbi:Hypothetical protein NTJ_01802 [Nesidiocoris tenuis]|uniref:Uncharacterized protein n=1 Tax=Nesidiocoris tenuis TaxID=355587 RepID=A0ABN7ADR0_9HEMI|nr:Hypothetical protein NTJ_01802 [Nesidiocoris tenuis]